MKPFPFLIAAALLSTPVLAQDVGVSLSIGDPGFYGRIDIGNAPRPRILYREPIVIVQEHVQVSQPIYLRVPPGHARRWRQHCGEYNACGQRVYFVQDDWYRDVYTPHYRGHDEHHDQHNDHDKGRGRGNGKKNKH